MVVGGLLCGEKNGRPHGESKEGVEGSSILWVSGRI